MDLPDDAPKFPKLPFILGDMALLAVAAFLAYTGGSTPTTTVVVSIVICTGLGVALGIAPFIVDYARNENALLTERQNALEALVRTTSSAADQAGIAANGLHEIAEITKRNLRTIEELPQRLDSAKSSIHPKDVLQHAAAVEALRTDFDQAREDQSARLEANTQSIERLMSEFTELVQKLSSSLSRIEGAITASSDRTAHALTEATATAAATAKAINDLASRPLALANDDPKKLKTRKRPAAIPPPPEPSLFTTQAAPDSGPIEAIDPSDVVESPGLDAFLADLDPPPSDSPADEDEDQDDNEETPPDILSLDPSDEESTIVDASPIDSPRSNPVASFAEEPPLKASPTSDGLTRLTVTAYIGIGNRLFLRGDGPGLSLEEGTPLQFVSIGKWRWETAAAVAPLHVSLWKNDQIECTSSGKIVLKPGAHIETSANF